MKRLDLITIEFGVDDVKPEDVDKVLWAAQAFANALREFSEGVSTKFYSVDYPIFDVLPESPS